MPQKRIRESIHLLCAPIDGYQRCLLSGRPVRAVTRVALRPSLTPRRAPAAVVPLRWTIAPATCRLAGAAGLLEVPMTRLPALTGTWIDVEIEYETEDRLGLAEDPR
jgi:hypothetical protein